MAVLVVIVAGGFFSQSGRHDVAPEEASGVFHRITADKSAGYVDILPPVIVKIHEQAAPGPAERKGSGLLGDIGKGSIVIAPVKIAPG